MSFAALLDAPGTTPAALCKYLDALDGPQRLAQTLALTARQQAKLFELVAGARRMTLEDLAPASHPPRQGVVHEGRNSLYAFRRFAKIFAVPEDPSKVATERWGYNRSGFTVENFVGPGYFVVVQQGDEVLVDYTQLPPQALLGGPRILSNSSRLSFFVFNGTRDVVRGVSRHVSIGRAWRGQRVLDNWFVLCRAEG